MEWSKTERNGGGLSTYIQRPPWEGVTSARPNARFKQGHPLSPHPTTYPALEIPISRFLHSLPPIWVHILYRIVCTISIRRYMRILLCKRINNSKPTNCRIIITCTIKVIVITKRLYPLLAIVLARLSLRIFSIRCFLIALFLSNLKLIVQREYIFLNYANKCTLSHQLFPQNNPQTTKHQQQKKRHLPKKMSLCA